MSESADRTPEEQAEIDAFKAKLRSLRFGSVPGGAREGRYVHRSGPNMSWEKGIAGEHRPDGSFMPYVTPDLKPITVKQFANQRGNYTRQIEDQRNGVDPFAKD